MKALAFLALVVSSLLPACGSDVATCASICGTGTDSCVRACTATEASCDANGQEATFQEYLTCVGNAGGLASQSALDPSSALTSVTTTCAKQVAAVASGCSAGAESDPQDASTSSDDTGVEPSDASGTGGLGEPCNADGTCDPGLACGIETVSTTNPSQPTFTMECGQ